MTNYYYKTMTKTHKDPTKFSGLITVEDFQTDYRGRDNSHGSTIAHRIAMDWKFDQKCKENLIAGNRSKLKGYKFKAYDKF